MIEVISILILSFIVLIFAPFKFFPDKMDGYGTYLAGVAAILAVFKFIAPYLLIFFFRKRYSNELIWKKFLNLGVEKKEGERISETEYMVGVIGYFKRNSDSNGYTDNDLWYDHIPYLSDDLFFNLDNTKMIGAKEDEQFSRVKKLFYELSHIVSLNSTPGNPIRNSEIKVGLCRSFSTFIKEVEKLEKMITEVPLPVKTIINQNEFYKSFLKK